MSALTKHLTVHPETVVFATDFSPASYNAGLYASAISMHFHTNLVVAHAFVLTQAALEVEAEKPLASQQRINLKHDLTLVAEVLESGKGETEIALLDGDPREVISTLAKGSSRALIVLGTHGRGSIDRYVLGSTAEGILQHSIGPALTVGPNVNILRAGALNIRRILYATDCSPEAAYAAPVAVALAGAFSAELDVLNVVHSTDAAHAEQLHRLQDYLYAAIETEIPSDALPACKPRAFVSAGKPPRDILSHIDEHDIDLLILGLHRDAFLGLQNRTSRVFPLIVRAKCPVITVASVSESQHSTRGESHK
jgi:nucleotide-binding universal stress UspA family protein